MKKLSFFVSAFALCASTSYAAINCSTLPTCASLGYTDKVADCPKVYNWNTSSKKLVVTTTPKAVICPFDTTQGRCLHDAKVGDLKYSLHTVNHEGWILCDGQSLDTTTYSALYNVIGSNYGMDGTKFRVPDYRGFFLRAYGTNDKNNALSSFWGSANSSLTTPQKEQLPNASFSQWIGWTGRQGNGNPDGSGDSSTEGSNWTYPRGPNSTTVSFYLGNLNGIYSGSHVIPANYAANIFIYAGR